MVDGRWVQACTVHMLNGVVIRKDNYGAWGPLVVSVPRMSSEDESAFRQCFNIEMTNFRTDAQGSDTTFKHEYRVLVHKAVNLSSNSNLGVGLQVGD